MANITFSYQGRVFTLSRKNIIQLLLVDNNYVKSDILLLEKIKEREKDNVSKFDYFRRSAGLIMLNSFDTDVSKMNALKKKLGYQVIIPNGKDIYSELINFFNYEFKKGTFDKWNVKHQDGSRDFITEAVSNFSFPVFLALYYIYKNDDIKSLFDIFNVLFFNQKPFYNSKIVNKKFFIISIVKRVDELKDNNFNSFTSGVKIYPFVNLIKNVTKLTYTPDIVKDSKIQGENPYFVKNKKLAEKLKKINENKKLVLLEEEYSFPIYNYELLKQFYGIPVCITEGVGNYDYFFKMANVFDSDGSKKIFTRRTGSTEPEIVNDGYLSISDLIDELLNNQSNLVERGNFYFDFNDFKNKMKQGQNDEKIWLTQNTEMNKMSLEIENPWVNTDKSYPHQFVKLLSEQYFNDFHSPYMIKYGENNPFTSFKPEANFFRRLFPFKMNEDNEQKANLTVNFLSKYILADQLVKIPGGVVNEDQQFLNASLKENVEKHTPHSQSGKINNLRMIPNGTFVNGYFNNVVLLEELIRRVYYPYIVQYSNLFHTNLSGTTSFEALEEMAENFKDKGLPNINEKDTMDYNFYNIIFDRMVKTFLNDVHEKKILQKSRINGRHFIANYSNPEKTNIIDFNDKKELTYSHKPSFGTYATPTDINGLLSKINRVKYYGFLEEAFGDTATPNYDINNEKNISMEIINHTGSDFYASQNEEHNKKYKMYDNLKNHLGTFLNKLFEYNYIMTNSFHKKFHFIEANHEYDQTVSRVKPLEALKEMSREITYEDLFYVLKIIPIHHANQTVDSNTVIDNWYNRAEKINSNKYNTNLARQLNINELVNSGLMGSISGIAGAHVYSSPLLEDYINDIIKNEYLFENQKNVKLLNKNINMQDLRRQVILRLADEDASKLLKTNFNKFNYSQMLEYVKNNKIIPPYLEKEHLGFIKNFTQKFSKNNYVTIEDINNAKRQLEEKFAEAIIWLENTPVRSNNIFINNNTANKPTQIDAFSTHFYYCFSDLLHKITNKKQYLDKISEISLKIDENVSYNEVVLKINELKELVLDTLINNVINENKEHDLISYFYVDDTNTSSAKPQFLKTVYYDLFRFIIEKNFEYLINEEDTSEIEFKENKDCDILSKIFLIARTYEIFAEYHTGLHKFVEQVYPIVDYYKNIIEQVRKLPRWWFDAAPMFNYDGRALRTTVETTDPETLKKLEKANNDEYAHILSEAKPDSFVTHIKESWIEDKTFIQNRLYRYYVRPVYNFFIPVLYNFKGGKNANLNPNDGLPYRVISDILPANTLKETKPSKDYIKIPDHIVFQDSKKLFKQTHQTELADGNYKKYELNEITVNTKYYPKYKLKHKDFLSRYVTHDTSILIPVMFENKGNVNYSSFISNNTAIINESDIYTYNNSAIQNTNIKNINYHSENGEQIPVTFSSGVYTFNPYVSNIADHFNFHTDDETRLQFSITAPFDSWISAVRHFLKQGKKVPKEYYIPDLKNFFDFTTEEWVEMFSDYKEIQQTGKKIYKYDYFNDLYKNKRKYFLYHHSSSTNYRKNKFALMPVLYRPVFIHRNNIVQIGYGLLDSKHWKASGTSWFVESEIASIATFFKAQGISGYNNEDEFFEFADIFDNRNTRKKATSIADLVCQNWREVYLWKGYGQVATYHYSEKVKWNSYDGWYYFFGNYKGAFNEVGDIFKGHKFEYTGLPWDSNRQMNFRQEFIWALQEIRNDIYHNTVYFDENINNDQPLNNLIKPLYENFKKD